MIKRTKLRRGEKVKRQCAVGGVGSVNSGEEEDIFNIATAPPDPLVTETATTTATADEAGFTIATAPSEEEGFTIATAPAAPAAAQTVSLIDAAASAAAIAAANAASGSVSDGSSAATAVAQVVATATAVAAAATSTAAAEGGEVENLSELTR